MYCQTFLMTFALLLLMCTKTLSSNGKVYKLTHSEDDINKILLESQIYRMEEENKLDTLKLYLDENFKDSFFSENEFHLDKLDHNQKKQLLEYLENI